MSAFESIHRVLVSLAIGAVFALYGTTTFASVTGHPHPGAQAWWTLGVVWLVASMIAWRWRWFNNLLVS